MGTLTVENGQLELRKSTTTTMTGEKPLTVKNGATLSGFGCLGNSLVTFGAGSILNPGVSGNSTTMTLTFLGDVVMNADSKLKLDIYNWVISSSRTLKKCSQLDLKGTLTMNGEIEIAIPQDERYALAFAAGDEFTLWTGTVSGNPTVKLGELPDGLKWDDSKLLSEGKLTVVQGSTGIEGITAGEVCKYQLSTIGGVVVFQMTGTLTDVKNAAKMQHLPSGVYVITGKGGSCKIVL